jgi:hypothetical protein
MLPGRTTPLYQKLLADPKFHQRILDFDRDRAEACRAAGCPDCGGRLHAANYLRKPRLCLVVRSVLWKSQMGFPANAEEPTVSVSYVCRDALAGEPTTVFRSN